MQLDQDLKNNLLSFFFKTDFFTLILHSKLTYFGSFKHMIRMKIW